MAGRLIPDRIELALEIIDPQPGESVLEAAGGSGVAAELACKAIAPDGSMLMIDRSSVAVDRAVARNRSALESGVLSIEQSELAILKGGPFDAFFSVDLNAFWIDGGADEIAAIARNLRPGGRAIIAYGVGPAGPHGDERLLSIATNFESAGFIEVKVIRDNRGAAITAIRK